jgi:undecaprenyl-diphosphatase
MIIAQEINLILIQGLSSILNYNTSLFYFINNSLENNFLNYLMPFLTDFGSLLAWCIICGLLYLFGGINAKKVAILGLLALFISNGVVYLLKPLIAEPRPFLVLGNVHQLVVENEIYSFPSGHTTSSFAAATVIGLKYNLKFANKEFKLIYLTLIFASIIGFSRIYIGVHYPLDVVFGALIGVSCALVVLRLEGQIFENKHLKMLQLDKITKINTLGRLKAIYNH